jgi:type VI secretion system secreted protein VgrG
VAVAKTALIKLGGEVLPDNALVVRYEAHEQLSLPYTVDVEFSLPLNEPFTVDTCLRQSMAMSLVDDAGNSRVFHGLVDRAEYLFFTGEQHHFRIRLRPSLASLAHRENCKIWQEADVVSIVKDVFAEAGVENVEWDIHNPHETRTYCVQYRESELNFVHRLFEDEGLFYFFRHTAEEHTMVVSDDKAGFVPADDAPHVSFSMSQGFDGAPLKDFKRTRSLRCNEVLLRDWDFEKPQVAPTANAPGTEKWPMPYYRYPGEFTKSAHGKLMAASEFYARRGDSDVGSGSSRAIGLRCGVPFDVGGARQSWINGEYVVVSLHTSGEQTLESGDGNEICVNRFEAIPMGNPYMPERTAQRPKIRGIQTAVVTGLSNADQAIHVDEYGRIKVRFFWDRIGQQDDTSSCWLRVSQLATGGTMLLPRVGWEMAVGFHEGNPDRPFSMGRIYNGEKVAPAGLPAAKASGGLKSYSTPGGAGINEINLGDAGGSMGWTLSAQKDLNVLIEHDKNETIAVDSSHDIKVNVQSAIGVNEAITIGGDQAEDVGSVRSNMVGGNQSISVGGNETNNATHNMLETVAGTRAYSVGGNMTVISNTVMQTVSGNVGRTVGSVQLSASIASVTDKVGGSYSETVGAIKAELVKGTSSEKVGGSKNATSVAAELHVLRAGYALECEGTVTYMVGGVHYQKIGGDFSVKGSLVTLLGATGDFKAGGGNLKLGGGPVVAKGSKIVAKAKGINVKLGASLKMG